MAFSGLQWWQTRRAKTSGRRQPDSFWVARNGPMAMLDRAGSRNAALN
jgi:hypothetical protein